MDGQTTQNRIRIGGRVVGPFEPTLAIAEIGVNHDGDVHRALRLVDDAAEAGADAVKVQVFRGRRLMHASSGFAEYQKQGTSDASPIEMLERYELDEASLRRVVARTRERGMLPVATPFSPDDVALVGRLNLAAVKIASPDIVNWPLLRDAARLGLPMIVSTGAATVDEIGAALGWLRGWNAAVALLHCVSSYPTPNGLANLAWIGELSARFGVPVGYSDHTTEPMAGALAVAGGAAILEKHLTYDRAAKGPDHLASADPAQFAQYVRAVRLAEQMRGGGGGGASGKHVLEVEMDVRRVSRQSIVARRDLRAGEPIGEADLTVQRPGSGIPAARWPDLIGKVARVPVRAGEMLTWNAVGGEAHPHAA